MKANTAQKQQPEQPETLWNMSNEKDVQEFLEELQANISNSQILTAGLISFLFEIENSRNHIHAQDICGRAIAHLFSWTSEHDEALEIYLKNLPSRKISSFERIRPKIL